MATRSTVGMKIEGDKYLAIYLSYGGYPSHMLDNLPDNYDDILEMIKGGDGPSVNKGVVDRSAPSRPIRYRSKYNWHSDMKKSGCEYYYLWDEEKNEWEYGSM